MSCIALLLTDRSIVYCMRGCSQIDRLYTKCGLFMGFCECMMQKCMFTHLSTQTSQCEYVCVLRECMFMFMQLPTWTLQREYVCMYVRAYIYDFAESNATTHYYVFLQIVRQTMYVQCSQSHRQDCNNDIVRPAHTEF